MESIVLEPLSEAEVKTMTLPAFFKGIDAPEEDSWQKLSAYKPGGKNDWLSLVGAPLGQRLGITHLRDINCLADKFFTVLASYTSRLHHDSPLGKDWRAYKKRICSVPSSWR
jgi:hypothetical protein